MLNTFERKIEVFMIKYAIYSSLITQKLIMFAFNDKPEALNEIGQNLAEDLDREAIRIAKEMNHGMSTNFIKILANQNMKWNSICRYFKKKHGFEPFMGIVAYRN